MDYRTYRSPHPAEDWPRLTLLLQVDASGHAGEGYRFAVDCHHLMATIWSRDLFDAPELEGYKLVLEVRGEDVDIRPNSMSSKWEDLDGLIGREKVLVYAPEGDEVLNSLFREKLTAAKEADERLGASIRWSIQGTPRGGLRLVLQGLPAGARALRSEPCLAADEGETIHMDTFEADADMKPDDPGRGPIPVLFGIKHKIFSLSGPKKSGR
jgi:hypothetical protein